VTVKAPAKVLYALLASVLAVCLLELTARVVLPVVEARQAQNDVRFTFAGVWAHQRNPFHTIDRELFWKMTPGYSDGELSINEKGFRGPDFSEEKPAHTFRIIVLGDSVTFGFKVRQEDTYAQKLSLLLSQAASKRRIEVINAGVIGYSSWQGRKLYETRLARHSPDVVVVLFGYNDHHGAVFTDREKYQRRDLEALTAYLGRISLFKAMVRALGGPLREEPSPRVSLDEFEENLRAIDGMARARGGRSVFLTVPVRPGVPLVENFRAVDSGADGKTTRVWHRQIDFAVQVFDPKWSPTLLQHFLASADLARFASDPENLSRLVALTRRYPDFPIFHYLLARCYRARGEADEAAQSMERCLQSDRERLELEAYNDRLRQMASASVIQLLDVAAALTKAEDSEAHFLDVVHLSPQGHTRLAQVLADYLAAETPSGISGL